jgi:hypothetical protein
MLDLLRLWRVGTTHESERRTRGAIGLMIALVWAVNALNHRPKDMAGERALMPTLLPFREDLTGESCAVREQGVLFFNGLLYDCAQHLIPRLSALPEDEDLQRMLGNMVSLDSLRLDLPVAITRRRRVADDDEEAEQGGDAKRTRGNNKAPKTTTARIPAGAPNLFEHLCHSFVDETEESVDVFLRSLHRVWIQYQSDLMEKIPYARNGPSYANFPNNKKTEYTTKLFRQVQLQEVFRCCVVRTDASVWENTFNTCFPESGRFNAGKQGYMQCQWTTIWASIHQQSRDVNWQMMRTAVREKWDELAWVSGSNSERIWNSGKCKTRTGVDFHNCNIRITAPVLVENPIRAGCLKWNPIVVGAAAWEF